jgi:hypothetical protein
MSHGWPTEREIRYWGLLVSRVSFTSIWFWKDGRKPIPRDDLPEQLAHNFGRRGPRIGTAAAPEWLCNGAAFAAPAIPAAESTLGSHPCVALSSAQGLPEWINRNPTVDRFSSYGANPFNFVSQPRGSLHCR